MDIPLRFAALIAALDDEELAALTSAAPGVLSALIAWLAEDPEEVAVKAAVRRLRRSRRRHM